MTAPLLQLLAEAREAGFAIGRDADGTLRIRGPKTRADLARNLLSRKTEVLAVVNLWNGRAPMLDWRQARILDDGRVCVLCGRRTLLLDPWDGQPCHKTCAESAIRRGAAEAEPGSAA